jgi:hypothetical protein
LLPNAAIVEDYILGWFNYPTPDGRFPPIEPNDAELPFNPVIPDKLPDEAI